MQDEENVVLQQETPTPVEVVEQEAKTVESVEPAPAPAEEPKPEEPKRTPWYQTRIDKLTGEKYEAARRAEAEAAARAEAVRRAEELEHQLQELRRGAAQQDQPKTEPQPRQQPPLSQAEIERMVEEKAAAKASEAAFTKQCNDIYDLGKAEFQDFDKALENFRLVGGLTPDFVSLVTEVNDPHKVLYNLGKDPDEAARILTLPTTKQAIELARYEARLNKPAPVKPVSKAPDPIRPIDGASRSSDDPEKMSMDQWLEWREKSRGTSR